MRDIARQVTLEDDVDGTGDAHLAMHLQAGVFGDLRIAAIGADQIFRPDFTAWPTSVGAWWRH